MLPSGSWLHIAFGFALGITISIFTIVAANLLKNNTATRKLLKVLVLFSLSVAVISFIYGSALSGGLLVQWRSLGFPGEEHAVKVIDIGYVQTQSGNIYYFSCSGCPKGNWSEGNWERVNKVTRKEFYMPSPGNCGTFPFLPISKQDFIDSESACISTWKWNTAKVVYAIDGFGRVYLWFHDNAEFGGGDVFGSWFEAFWFSAIERILFLIGGVASCVLGLSIILLLAFSSFIKRKMQKHNFQTNSVE